MACDNNSKFRIKTKEAEEITASNKSLIDVCTATKILDRLHKEFTEEYVATAETGKTVIQDMHKNNPTFFLRKQPNLAEFNSETVGGTIDRFYNLFTKVDEENPVYRGAVSAIMKGEYDTQKETYLIYPESIRTQTDFSQPSNFKGVYGLVRVNEILEKKIADTVNSLRVDPSSNVLVDAKHYDKRQEIKKTFEEIASRENQIYREKFLNIILIVVGIFIISTQLVQKYFSSGGGDGGFGSSGSGFSGAGGWLSTRFGSGSGGLFSRFGGLGLGSSGRSRVGNLFTNSPYKLETRE
jgi:hypothetical protein